MFNLFDEILSKVPDVLALSSPDEIDDDWILDVIDLISDIEDDNIWQSFSLPLQCWYNDNIIEFADVESKAINAGKTFDEDDLQPFDPCEYDPSNVELSPEDLFLFDKSEPYTFIVLTTDNLWHCGSIKSIGETTRKLSLLSSKDVQYTFDFSQLKVIRLVCSATSAIGDMQELSTEFGGNYEAYTAANMEKTIEAEVVEVVEDSTVPVDSPNPATAQLEVKPEKPVAKSRRQQRAEKNPETGIRLLVRLILKNTEADFDDIYLEFLRQGGRASENGCRTKYASAMTIMEESNALGLTSFKLKPRRTRGV